MVSPSIAHWAVQVCRETERESENESERDIARHVTLAMPWSSHIVHPTHDNAWFKHPLSISLYYLLDLHPSPSEGASSEGLLNLD